MSNLFQTLFNKDKGAIAPPTNDSVSGSPPPNTDPEAATQLQNENATLKQQLDALREENTQLKTRPTPANQGVNNPPAIPSVIEDEETAFAMRQAPVITAALSAASQVAMLRAEQHIGKDPVDGRLLKKYQGEVDRLFSMQPLQYQANPDTYLACFQRIIGAHRADLDKLRGTSEDPFIESVGGGAPPNLNPQRQPSLTDEELRVAKRMGVTPERYLKTKQEATHVLG